MKTLVEYIAPELVALHRDGKTALLGYTEKHVIAIALNTEPDGSNEVSKIELSDHPDDYIRWQIGNICKSSSMSVFERPERDLDDRLDADIVETMYEWLRLYNENHED